MTLRPEVDAVLRSLLVASETSREVTLDAVGVAIGAMSISPDELDALLAALEAQGRHVSAPAGGGGEARLGLVIDATRALVAENGARPTMQEVAARSGLTVDEVRAALELLRVMQMSGGR